MNPSIALAPFSSLYGLLVRARLSLYQKEYLTSTRLSVPVISVGNMTVGGTGKTPLVSWIARAVAKQGRRVCVLTRGYGRRNERVRVVVSDGVRLLADAEIAGDEPRLLAEQLLGSASIVCDADRVSAAHWAIEHLGAEVFILDDGFQHVRLRRDLDIVTIDATAPWGGGHLLPRGRLREPLQGLKRAGCVIITRADLTQDVPVLRDEIERWTSDAILILESRMRTTQIKPLDVTTKVVFEELAAQRVGAFCATGNPHAFFKHLRKEEHQLIYTRAYPDHHSYRQSDMDSLVSGAEAMGAQKLLTTAKDAVKLRALYSKLPIFVVEIEPVFDAEEKLLALVKKIILRDREANSSKII